MPLDYKYTKQPASRARWHRKSLWFVLVFFLILASVYGFSFYQIRISDELILTGQYKEAIQRLEPWRLLPVLTGQIYERMGTAELLWHGTAGAQSHFQQSKKRPFFAPVGFWHEVIKTLWTHGRYNEGLFYTDHIFRNIQPHNIVRFYRAGFLTGVNQLDLAEKELAAAGMVPGFAKEISTLREEIQRRQSTGQYTFLYDRENLPVVSKTLSGTLNILYSPVQPLLMNPSGNYLTKLDDQPGRQATTTLDYRIQNAALKALEKYAGAIVLIDVKNGDILAAASSLKGKNSLHPDGTSVATHVQYEPGSIIKMITLAGALESHANPEKLFPMNCEGSLKLSENKILYDWKMHNQVKDINVATAVSCNVGFAQIGLAMKPNDLLGNLRTLGFDAKLEESYLPLELGKIIQSNINDDYLANLSIGLEYLKITPLHAAMIASAIANEGLSITPRLLLHYRNLVGIPYSVTKPIPFRTFMSKETASKVAEAMEQVVIYEEGTGRRAAIQNLPIAMKTGTAGDGAKGYDAIMIGFLPAKNPKVAFSVVVEHCGKAEFEGARVTKLFLESIQGYIQ